MINKKGGIVLWGEAYRDKGLAESGLFFVPASDLGDPFIPRIRFPTEDAAGFSHPWVRLFLPPEYGLRPIDASLLF